MFGILPWAKYHQAWPPWPQAQERCCHQTHAGSPLPEATTNRLPLKQKKMLWSTKQKTSRTGHFGFFDLHHQMSGRFCEEPCKSLAKGASPGHTPEARKTNQHQHGLFLMFCSPKKYWDYQVSAAGSGNSSFRLTNSTMWRQLDKMDPWDFLSLAPNISYLTKLCHFAEG